MYRLLYTQSLGGLTENDFILAQEIDMKAKVKYSRKFLRENPVCSQSAL